MTQHAKLRDPALEQHYQNLFAMYGTPGWRALMEDVEAMIAQHDQLAGVDTAEQLWHRKGELLQMQWLRNHEQANEYAYKAMLADEQGKDETEASTGGKATVVA